MADDVVRTVTIKSTTEGVDQTRAAVKGLAEDHDKLATVSEKAAKATERIGGQYEALQRRLDPVHRATAQLAKEHDTLDKALAQGLVTQQRYNQLLAAATVNAEKLGAATRQATGFQAAFATATSGVSAQLVAMSAGAGPVGTFLAALGPWGLAAAAGIGAASAAFNYLSEGAAHFGDKAIEVRKFIEVTGLAAGEIKVLTQEGGKLGVSTDQITTGVEKFSVQLNEARKATGDLFQGVRAINPELARQLSETRSTAQAWDLLAKALRQAGDESQRNALARAAFGRGGVELGIVAQNTDARGGIAAAGAEIERATGLTTEWVKETARLRAENAAIEKQIETMKESAYARPILERQNAYLKTQREITEEFLKTVGKGVFNSGTPFIASRAQGVVGGRGETAGPLPGGTGFISEGGRDAQAAAASGSAIRAEAEKTTQAFAQQAQEQERIANTQKEILGLLGPAATEYEKMAAKVNELGVALLNGKLNQEQYNRAVKAVDYELPLRALQRQQEVSEAVGESDRLRATTQAKIADEIDKGTLSETKLAEILQTEVNAREKTKASIEEQLEVQRDQLRIAETRTQEERNLAEERAKYNAIVRQTGDVGLAEEAARMERSVKEAQQAQEKFAAAARDAASAEKDVAKYATISADEIARAADSEYRSRISSLGGTINDTTGTVTTPHGESAVPGGSAPGGGEVSTIDDLHYADMLAMAKRLDTQASTLIMKSSSALFTAAERQQFADDARELKNKSALLKISPYLQLSTEKGDLIKQQEFQRQDIEKRKSDKEVGEQIALLNAKAGASNLYKDENERNQFKIEAEQLALNLETDPAKRAILQTQFDDLIASLDDLTDSTDELDKTNKTVLPGVLSSLYKGGNVTGLGFEHGGIMTRDGRGDLIPFRSYAEGGITRSPSIFQTSENYHPEAIIPLKGGGVPVLFTGEGPGGRGGNMINVGGLHFYIQGGGGVNPNDLGFRSAMGRAAGDLATQLNRQSERL